MIHSMQNNHNLVPLSAHMKVWQYDEFPVSVGPTHYKRAVVQENKRKGTSASLKFEEEVFTGHRWSQRYKWEISADM